LKIESLNLAASTICGQDKAFSKKGDLWIVSLGPASGGIYKITK
jgi:hypothetical protein